MKRRNTLFLIAVLVVAAGLTGLFRAEGQGGIQARRAGMRTVWDGVYSADQAMRGKEGYELDCASCHGDNLFGARNGPLAGEKFMEDWRGVRLYSLFDRVESMPPDGFRLGEEYYLEVMAYMLEVNGFPAGDEELKTETLRGILIQGKDGPQPAANFSLVQTIGCLTQGPDKKWLVTEAIAPIRTRDPEPSTDEDLLYLRESELGSEKFRLMNVYPRPDKYRGHKVEVKGFLIRGEVDSINVSASQSLASSCEPGGSLP